MGRFSWLGGKDDAWADAQSAARARKHRRSIDKATKAELRWEQQDRRDHGDDHPFPRRNSR